MHRRGTPAGERFSFVPVIALAAVSGAPPAEAGDRSFRSRRTGADHAVAPAPEIRCGGDCRAEDGYRPGSPAGAFDRA